MVKICNTKNKVRFVRRVMDLTPRGRRYALVAEIPGGMFRRCAVKPSES